MNRRANLSHPHKTDLNQNVFEAKPVKLEQDDSVQCTDHWGACFLIFEDEPHSHKQGITHIKQDTLREQKVSGVLYS